MSKTTLPRQHNSVVITFILVALSVILILVGNRLRRQS